MNAIDKLVAQQLAAALSRDDFLRLLQTFDADLGRLAGECTAAAEAGDEAAMRRAAHSLAGAAAGIGAHRLEAAARLAMPGAVLPDPLTGLVARIRDETASVLAELATLARSPKA